MILQSTTYCNLHCTERLYVTSKLWLTWLIRQSAAERLSILLNSDSTLYACQPSSRISNLGGWKNGYDSVMSSESQHFLQWNFIRIDWTYCDCPKKSVISKLGSVGVGYFSEQDACISYTMYILIQLIIATLASKCNAFHLCFSDMISC